MRRSHWMRGITLDDEQRAISSRICVHTSALATCAGGEADAAGAGESTLGGALDALGAGAGAGVVAGAGRGAAGRASVRGIDAGGGAEADPAATTAAGGSATGGVSGAGLSTLFDAASSVAFAASADFCASPPRASGVTTTGAGERPPSMKIATAATAASATIPATAYRSPLRRGAAA
jgi:hypothetical protein